MKNKTILMLSLFFLFISFLPLSTISKNSTSKKTAPTIIDEIIAACNNGGKDNLVQWMKQNKDRVNRDTIIEIAEYGCDKQSESILGVALVLAQEKMVPSILAEVYLNVAYFLTNQYEFAEAVDYCDKAIPLLINPENLNLLAKLCNLKALLYYDLANFSQLLEAGPKACSLLAKLGDFKKKSKLDALLACADIFQGNKEKGLDNIKKAMTIYKKLADKPDIVNLCRLIGKTLLLFGMPQESFNILQDALTNLGTEGYDQERAGIYLEIGISYFFQGKSPIALEMYQKALNLFEKNKNTAGKGLTFFQIGELHLINGNILLALKNYDNASICSEEAKDSINLANIYREKGILYSIISDYSRSLEMYDKALSLYQQELLIEGKGAVYLGKADILRRTGNYTTALNMYDEALHIFEKKNFPLGIAWAYKGIADTYYAADQLDKAEDFCLKGLPIFEKLPNPQGCASIYRTLGEIYYVRNNYSEALKFFDISILIYKNTKDTTFTPCLFLQKAITLAMQFKLDESFKAIDESFIYLEKLRQQTAFSQLKGKIMENLFPWFEKAIKYMLYLEHYQRAFQYTEAIKTRVFLDQLSEGIVDLEKGISPDLRAKRDLLLTTLSNLAKTISETPPTPQNILQDLNNKYQTTEKQYEDLLLEIRLRNPQYAAIQYPKPITSEICQQEVLKNGEVLLQYLLFEDSTYAFIISKKQFNVFSLNIKQDDLNHLINLFLLSLTDKKKEMMLKYGSMLYQILFQPIEEYLKGFSNIYIVPDSKLANIPFEALVNRINKNGEPNYLLEDYSFKYIPSASTLYALRKYDQSLKATHNFIGFGDPVYDYDNFKQSLAERGSSSTDTTNSYAAIIKQRYEQNGGIMNRLVASGEEVKDIAQIFKNNNYHAVVHLRENASEMNCKATDMKNFGYIHFSCHGILTDQFQSLVLAQLPNAQEDGYFTLNEMMNCEYQAQLVVLSACQTGNGKMARAEGVTGLARAVMYAGSANVLASLWNVDDRATHELMVIFYKHIIEKGLTIDNALRQAKLAMIKSERFNSPYFWSAFVLYGE